MKCSFCGGERERLKPFIYEWLDADQLNTQR
jgi:hypothetical protein